MCNACESFTEWDTALSNIDSSNESNIISNSIIALVQSLALNDVLIATQIQQICIDSLYQICWIHSMYMLRHMLNVYTKCIQHIHQNTHLIYTLNVQV